MGDVERLWEQVQEAVRPVIEDALAAMRVLADWWERLEPEQRAALEAYAALPQEIRSAMRPVYCHCFCGRWHHVGICQGEASTTRAFTSPITGTMDVQLCEACAADIDAHR